jgi:hypothetical protein
VARPLAAEDVIDVARSMHHFWSKEIPMIRKYITPLLVVLGLGFTATACRVGARVGPAHAGGGISSR